MFGLQPASPIPSLSSAPLKELSVLTTQPFSSILDSFLPYCKGYPTVINSRSLYPIPLFLCHLIPLEKIPWSHRLPPSNICSLLFHSDHFSWSNRLIIHPQWLTIFLTYLKSWMVSINNTLLQHLPLSSCTILQTFSKRPTILVLICFLSYFFPLPFLS